MILNIELDDTRNIDQITFNISHYLSPYIVWFLFIYFNIKIVNTYIDF
jgi:hypothetical protein